MYVLHRRLRVTIEDVVIASTAYDPVKCTLSIRTNVDLHMDRFV